MTRKQNVLNALRNGEQLSAEQIQTQYGVANPRALVNTLRMEGYPVYLNKRKNETRGTYRLGSASREVIAAGYKALANGLV